MPSVSGRVEMAHGSGGYRSHQLIQGVFRDVFRSQPRRGKCMGASELSLPVVDGLQNDAALLTGGPERLAVTTDAYVVSPLFFSGGDIGKLSVVGTLNDLAMIGAEPRALTASFVLEEGLEVASLVRIAQSMAEQLACQGIEIVAGDTKVVEKGRGDGVYISTTGLGSCPEGLRWQPSRIREGDSILLSGDLGRHGMTILASREGLELSGALESDCALLWPAVRELLSYSTEIACLRDVTRGGLGVTLNELADSAELNFEVDEQRVPISDAVGSASELLGLDPLYLACEGRFLLFVREEAVSKVLAALKAVKVSSQACVIGRVGGASAAPSVALRTPFGTLRPLDWLGAEQLPRIC